MTGILQTLLDDYRALLERLRGRAFLDAAMAACALAACARGEVTFSQRIRVDQILDTLERLQVYDPHDGVDRFNHFSSAILDSSREGHEKAHAALRPFVHDPESAGLLVRICLAVAEAGGEKTLSQEIEVVMLCGLLGVDPVPAGLYTDRASGGRADRAPG